MNILVEQDYRQNKRFTEFLQGIKCFAEKKKLSVAIDTNPADVDKSCKVLIVVGASWQWTQGCIRYFRNSPLRLIVFGFPNSGDLSRQCNFVSQNYEATMYKIASLLLRERAGDIAFIGFNPDSVPDIQKLRGAVRAAQDHRVKLDIFYNYGDIRRCIDSFLQKRGEYQNLICVNDIVAILVGRQLSDARRYQISGYDSLLLTKYLKSLFLTTSVDYRSAGAVTAELYSFLYRSEYDFEAAVSLNTDILLRGEKLACEQTPPFRAAGERAAKIDFYGDDPVSFVEKLDSIFRMADETDLQILRRMMNGETYEAIAEASYLSLNAIKYRVNKLKGGFGKLTRAEFIAMLKNFGVVIG